MRVRRLVGLVGLLFSGCSLYIDPPDPGGGALPDAGVPAECARGYQADIIMPAAELDTLLDFVHLAYQFSANTSDRAIALTDEDGVDYASQGTFAGTDGAVETWVGYLDPSHTYTLQLGWLCVLSDGSQLEIPLARRNFDVSSAAIQDAGVP